MERQGKALATGPHEDTLHCEIEGGRCEKADRKRDLKGNAENQCEKRRGQQIDERGEAASQAKAHPLPDDARVSAHESLRQRRGGCFSGYPFGHTSTTVPII